MTNDELDGLAIAHSVSFVDTRCQGYRFRLELLICAKLRPRRRSGLHQNEAATPFRIARKQMIDAAEAVQHSLGVIEPFDTDRDLHIVAKLKARAHRLPAFDDRLLAVETAGGQAIEIG